jgi:parvulin-like peptidyl-prolyl isomerase
MWTLFLTVALVSATHAAVLDRLAMVVGNQVFTEGEVQDEVRLTQFLNQQPLDLGPEQRRAAAERLVDQQLIRNEMQIGGYPQPSQSEADAMLRNFRQEHYRSIAQFRAALEKYGITEEQLKQHLLWQLAAVRFTDARFRPVPAPTLPAPSIQTADRLRAGADAPAGNSVDQQMDAWLKTARSQIRIDFKKEAFQ